MNNPNRSRLLVNLLLALGILLPTGRAEARAIKWNRVINANPKKLSAADKRRAAKLMNKINVYYGCSDTVANCLAIDPGCQTARRIAGIIVRMVKKGRSDSRIKREIKKRGVSAHPFKKYKFNLKKRPRIGASSSKAKLTIVEFADFECPFCRVISPVVKQLVRKFASKGVALVYKHFPVSTHKRAVACGRAAYAAHKQGKFWQYHDLLYKKSPRLSDSQLESYAKKIGLNMTSFRSVRDSLRARRVLAADKKEGLRAGTMGTPTFFINGKMYKARKDYDEFKDRIEEELHLIKGGR